MSKKSNVTLSLVVPVLNEEELIEDTIKIYTQDIKKLFTKFEIIIVDDGSTDKTPQILAKLKNAGKIKLITHTKNLGVGEAITNGFAAAKMEWVMTNSADRPFDLLDLSKVLKDFSYADAIIFARFDRSANPIFRKLTSTVSRLLVKTLFRVPISDFHFVQIYKRLLLRKVKAQSRDTFMPAELLVKLSKKGYKITEHKAVFHGRTAGKSKYNNPIRYLRYLYELLKFWVRLNITKNV